MYGLESNESGKMLQKHRDLEIHTKAYIDLRQRLFEMKAHNGAEAKPRQPSSKFSSAQSWILWQNKIFSNETASINLLFKILH